MKRTPTYIAAKQARIYFRASWERAGCDRAASSSLARMKCYKSKRGKLVRKGAPTLTLYHFTSPTCLPTILEHGIVPQTREHNAHMLPGLDAVWLTVDPEGNTVREAVTSTVAPALAEDKAVTGRVSRQQIVFAALTVKLQVRDN